MTRFRNLSDRRIVTLGAIGIVFVTGLSASTRYALVSPAGARTLASGPCAGATRAKPMAPLAQFPATNLPTGSATGAPGFLALPAGFTLKHYHGGPTYVYVISGALRITDAAGAKTYCTGSFFAEGPNHVHTVHALRASQVFSITLLAPGKQALVPVK